MTARVTQAAGATVVRDEIVHMEDAILLQPYGSGAIPAVGDFSCCGERGGSVLRSFWVYIAVLFILQ